MQLGYCVITRIACMGEEAHWGWRWRIVLSGFENNWIGKCYLGSE